MLSSDLKKFSCANIKLRSTKNDIRSYLNCIFSGHIWLFIPWHSTEYLDFGWETSVVQSWTLINFKLKIQRASSIVDSRLVCLFSFTILFFWVTKFCLSVELTLLILLCLQKLQMWLVEGFKSLFEHIQVHLVNHCCFSNFFNKSLVLT